MIHNIGWLTSSPYGTHVRFELNFRHPIWIFGWFQFLMSKCHYPGLNDPTRRFVRRHLKREHTTKYWVEEYGRACATEDTRIGEVNCWVLTRYFSCPLDSRISKVAVSVIPCYASCAYLLETFDALLQTVLGISRFKMFWKVQNIGQRVRYATHEGYIWARRRLTYNSVWIASSELWIGPMGLIHLYETLEDSKLARYCIWK